MLLPDKSRKAIKDESKANGLEKLMFCLKTSWFCVQGVGQLVSPGNPINFLELNTFFHCLCCLATYGAWWRKPLDNGEPELIDASKEETLDFYARLCIGKRLH